MMNSVSMWSQLYQATHRKKNQHANCFFRVPFKIGAHLALKLNSDPTIRIPMGDRDLLVPWSHNLPWILEEFPLYETEIARLANYLHQADGRLCMIDVGANVGDTIATLIELTNASFLCIEGSARYFDLLLRNYGHDPKVEPFFALLGAQENQQKTATLVEKEGTAHVEKIHLGAQAAPWMNLDDVVGGDGPFSMANFLKIDTDGYDFHVLRGSAAFLKHAKPSIHLEVSPQHWKEYGDCDPLEAIIFLADMGYQEVLVYDNAGYLIGVDNTKRPQLMNSLSDYAMRKPGFYLNLLTLHSSRSDVQAFYSSEIHRARDNER